MHAHLFNSFRSIYPATSHHPFLNLINKDIIRESLYASRTWRSTRLLTFPRRDGFLTHLPQLVIWQITCWKLGSKNSLEHTKPTSLLLPEFAFAPICNAGLCFVRHLSSVSHPLPSNCAVLLRPNPSASSLTSVLHHRCLVIRIPWICRIYIFSSISLPFLLNKCSSNLSSFRPRAPWTQCSKAGVSGVLLARWLCVSGCDFLCILSSEAASKVDPELLHARTGKMDVGWCSDSWGLPGTTEKCLCAGFGEHLSSPAAWVINPSWQTTRSWELWRWLAHHTLTNGVLGWK